MLPDAVCSSSSFVSGAEISIKREQVAEAGQSFESKIKISDTVKIKSEQKLKQKSKKLKRSKLQLKDGNICTRPTPQECDYVTFSLGLLHPHIVMKNDDRRATLLESCGMRDSVTDAIISTMLSQNTTDANSKAAFASLKHMFFSNQSQSFSDLENSHYGWDAAALCDPSKIENAIRVAGLAKTRTERIQAILQTLRKERGTACFEYLRDMKDDEQIKKELGRFKGLGPKTISCVLLFALGRKEFPVDTHVLRISQKMGWVPQSYGREEAYKYLNLMVPDELKMDLHCLLVTHGKHCHACAANGKPQFPPEDGSKLLCPLAKVFSWGGKLPMESISDKLPFHIKKYYLMLEKLRNGRVFYQSENGTKKE
eukprot:CAMPEP_0184864956 /NCGR_PEP_ID=MMETSP0580-20130426/16493_1 /TAXON_ID=1118495 /ORGANISM="Dactyliosolen fragilissimus" /LENGTH=368 /DNA_ID=CAMNT_0027363933 /DNA_START=182 /DNA_END=1285 /DNA_ORIENTATION=-